MIITCPACDAQYLLPDDAVGPKGRRVKCTSCANVWTQQPEMHAEVEEAVFEPDFTDPFKARRERIGGEVAAAVYVAPAPVIAANAPLKDVILKTAGMTLAMLVLTFGAALAIRHSVVTWWPPAALMYETIGMPAPAPGANLALKDVVARTTGPLEKDGMLEVSGKLSNPSKSPQFLPVLRIRLNGEEGVLKDWDINLYGKTLPPGKDAAFSYSLKDAKPEGQNVTLFFVD